MSEAKASPVDELKRLVGEIDVQRRGIEGASQLLQGEQRDNAVTDALLKITELAKGIDAISKDAIVAIVAAAQPANQG